MVIMSKEAFERLQFKSEIYFKLKEAELEAKTTGSRSSHKEVFSDLRKQLSEKATGENV
jgi:PHD/YefM family antitoxin component YafN of YafNO toxin-antitoxin module